MEKENCFDRESDSDDEEKAATALSDSDIDEIEDLFTNMNRNYESDEYRYWIKFDQCEVSERKVLSSDDDTIYPVRVIDGIKAMMKNESIRDESEEFR